MKVFCVLLSFSIVSVFFSLIIVYFVIENYKINEAEERALHYFNRVQSSLILETNRKYWAEWIYKTNENEKFSNKLRQELISARNAYALFIKKLQNEIGLWNWEKFQNLDLVQSFRQIMKIFVPFVNSWDENHLKIQQLILEEDLIHESIEKNVTSSIDSSRRMRNASKDAKVHNLTKFQQLEIDAEFLGDHWIQLHNSLGPKFYKHFVEFVRVFNDVGESKSFDNGMDYFLSNEYQMRAIDLENKMKFTWKNLENLYREFHAYYRWNLVKKFGRDEFLVSSRSTIPVHLISLDQDGNWDYIGNETELKIQINQYFHGLNLTKAQLYKDIERNFVAMNFSAFPKTFWIHSKLQKSKPKKKLRKPNQLISKIKSKCTPKWYNGGKPTEFRVSTCRENVTLSNFRKAYSNMGTLKHYILASNQTFQPIQKFGMEILTKPITGIWSMTAVTKFLNAKTQSTPKISRYDVQIGILYQEALLVLPKLAKAMSSETWRWDVFQNRTLRNDPRKWNCHWWKLRNRIEGIKPPLTRKSNDFDPAEIPKLFRPTGNTPEFLTIILQYQIFQTLCYKSGYFKDRTGRKGNEASKFPLYLHLCDLSRSNQILEKIRSFMKLGSSKSWLDAFQFLTEDIDSVSPAGILEYFAPLFDWLKIINKKHKIPVGWIGSSEIYSSCVQSVQ